MCGICGIFNYGTSEPARLEVIEAMAAALRERGPDGSGSHLDGPLGLGHRRLSVIDVSEAGRQPMSNEDGTIWLTYNGEIYNYRELRPALEGNGHRFRSRTDSEVIIHLYEERGLDFVNALDGMFALALWDAPHRRLVLARDRLGIKPLVTYTDRRGLLFASDARAFLSVPTFPARIRPRALAGYVSRLSVDGDSAIFDGVAKVPPGTLLVVENGRSISRRYWELNGNPRGSARSEAEAVEELREHLARVTTSHLVADVPVGAFLSGGLDSSSVVTLAARGATDRLETFSVTFPEVPRVDEARFARLMADRAATRHTEFDMQYDFVRTLEAAVPFCDEPFAVWSAYALFEICRLARSRVKVVLSGDGGDEIFAGYPRHHMPLGDATAGERWRGRAARRWLESPVLHHPAVPDRLRGTGLRALWRVARSGWGPARRYLGLVRYVDTAAMLEVFDRGLLADEILPQLSEDENRFRDLYASIDATDEVNRRLEVDIRTSLVDEMLTKVDRMSMAFGLEARVPLLDHRLVELAIAIPGHLKAGPLGVKHIFKRAMEPELPAEILRRGKAGFNLPLAEWFRGPLEPYLRDRLSISSLNASGVFDPDAVGRLLERHLGGRRDHSALLFAVLVWVIWHQHLVAGRTMAGATARPS